MEHFFETREQASAAAADRIATALQHRLDHQKAATLVVSGGTSPVQCFEALAHMDLCWPRVGILPSDDRWVPGEHDDSNEKLVRNKLLVNGAASADLLPFYTAEMSVEERAAILDQDEVEYNFIWIANSEDLGLGTVSKIDGDTITEAARYYTYTCSSNLLTPECDDLNGSLIQTVSNAPSRTAV